jgi:glyoxalase superfamily protein
MTAARFKALCMDAADPHALGAFWARVLGGHLADLGRPDTARVDPDPGVDDSRSIWLDRVPEPRTGKNRVHLDLRLPTPDPAPLIAAGATKLRDPDDEISWWVLADPDGNLFCAFPPRAGTAPPATAVYELVVDSRDAAAQAAWWAGVTGGTVEPDDDGAAVTGAAGFPFAP